MRTSGKSLALALTCFHFWHLGPLTAVCDGDIALPSILSDHMVLQQGQKLPIWGWGDPGEHVSVSFGSQEAKTVTGPDGTWKVMLDPLGASDQPQTMSVMGKTKVDVHDVLVGEVWLCSGQSNMEWPLREARNADLALAAADDPMIRHTTVRNMGLQKPNHDYYGGWQLCTPESIGDFSAVGYFFGRNLRRTLHVPIGLIDNAWGGSACEAWVRRDLLAADPEYDLLLKSWTQSEANALWAASYAAYEQQYDKWMQAQMAAKKTQQTVPELPRGDFENRLLTNGRPGNLYNGRLAPVMPFGIRGAIWYQGETNASRAYQYRKLFPLMIQNWRDDWGQGDFPFYWVQLADFQDENSEPSESEWAELREAQTRTLITARPHAGQAVIIDLGEANDIHPRNKEEVANRLSRWALANEYDQDLVFRSPEFQDVTFAGGKAIVKCAHAGSGLRTVDESEVKGFSIAGNDQRWMWATVRIIDPTTIEVSSADVPQPAAVRYAWSDNPICNVYSKEGLPLTPFRTDDWPGLTSDNH